MKLIIAGGRDFNDVGLATFWFNEFLKEHNIDKTKLEIVSGGAQGADSVGELLAYYDKIELKIFPANWEEHGKSAGFKRNVEMAEYADALLAFWDGESKGTKHMIETATEKGLIVKVVKYTNF